MDEIHQRIDRAFDRLLKLHKRVWELSIALKEARPRIKCYFELAEDQRQDCICSACATWKKIGELV